MNKRNYLLLALLFVFELGQAQIKNSYFTFKTDNKNIYAIGFSAGGKVLAVGDGSTVKIFSMKNNSLLRQFADVPNHQILALDISKDSSLFASGGKDSVIVLRNFKSGAVLKRLHYQKGIITSVQFSPDGRYLASGGSNHKVYIYDIHKQKVIYVLADEKKDISSIKYSPEGKLLATTGGDKNIYLYDSAYRLKAVLKGHKSWVRALSFNPDGTQLISGGDDKKVFFWDLKGHPRQINKISFFAFGWVTGLDYGTKDSYVVGTFFGLINLVSRFAEYSLNIKKPVTRIKFVPNSGDLLKIVVATQGSGVLMMDAVNMEITVQ
ncbi:MAG: WD40 repeat domain-containing protein [Bacteroidales bacterium]|nr:WD40 repeat domain-containing protein [Bacteroidales bacterium]